MSEENLDKIIDSEEGLGAVPEIEEAKKPVPSTPANEERFSNLMKEEKSVVGKIAGDPKTSLMDAVRDMNFSGMPATGGKVTMESLLAQTEQVKSKIDAVKETLESPNINIKSAQHVKLLENKLSHIDESLRIALSKAGVEYTPTPGQPLPGMEKQPNPIERFLGLVTDGQWQLANLSHELNVMSRDNKELSPVNMLAIQIKVAQIGQELQLFYSLLSKALESVKTIMNIQV